VVGAGGDRAGGRASSHQLAIEVQADVVAPAGAVVHTADMVPRAVVVVLVDNLRAREVRASRHHPPDLLVGRERRELPRGIVARGGLGGDHARAVGGHIDPRAYGQRAGAVDAGEVAQVHVIGAARGKSRHGAGRLDAIAGERQGPYGRAAMLEEATVVVVV